MTESGLFLLRVGAFERRWLINLKSFHVDGWTAMDKHCFTSFLSPIFLLCPKYAWPMFTFWNISHRFCSLGHLLCSHYFIPWVCVITVQAISLSCLTLGFQWCYLLPYQEGILYYPYFVTINPIIPVIKWWCHMTRWQRIKHGSLK